MIGIEPALDRFNMKNFQLKKTNLRPIAVFLIAFTLTAFTLSEFSSSGNKGQVYGQVDNSRVAQSSPSFQGKVETQNVHLADRIWTSLDQIKNVHPLVLAATQLLVVAGICIWLTDNKELELYLKIDFRPPKTDILN